MEMIIINSNAWLVVIDLRLEMICIIQFDRCKIHDHNSYSSFLPCIVIGI